MFLRIMKFPTFVFCIAVLIADLAIEVAFPSLVYMAPVYMILAIIAESISNQTSVQVRALQRSINDNIQMETEDVIMTVCILVSVLLMTIMTAMVVIFLSGAA